MALPTLLPALVPTGVGGGVAPVPPSPIPVTPGGGTKNDFQYLFYDLLTLSFLGALPMAGVTWSQQLNAAGQFSGTINMADPRVQLLDPGVLTAPGRTAMFIDYKGTLVWGGASLTPSPYDSTTFILSYTATECWDYLNDYRMQAADYSSPPFSGITGPIIPMSIWGASFTGTFPAETGWDPLLIAAQVINDALGYQDTLPVLNGNPFGGMQLMLNGTALDGSGAPTDYLASGTATPLANYIGNINYPYESFQKVGQIVTQLAGFGFTVGFDFGGDVAYSNGPGSQPVVTINLAYPRRGRVYAQNNVVVKAFGTSRGYTVTPDPSTLANTLYETGGSQAIAISQNINALEQGYALFEDSISRSQIQSDNILGLLQELGLGDLYLTSYPAVTFSVKVPLFGSDPQLGQFIVGDNCRLLIDPDFRFPNGIDSEWRITAYTIDLPDQGDATMTLTLSPPPVYPTGAYI